MRQFSNARFMTNVVVGDEAAFALNGKVNTWNVKKYTCFGDPSQFNYDLRSSRQKINLGRVMW